jgi:hypothetical protein
MLRAQFGMPFWRSVVTALYAAKAAVTFQRGDYQGALPDLTAYYELILRGSTSHLRPEAVAQLELDWWIIHRERNRRDAGDLPKSLARLQAEIYGRPEDRFIEHALDRAEPCGCVIVAATGSELRICRLPAGVPCIAR